MKTKYLFTAVFLCFLILLSGCSSVLNTHQASAKWHEQFVVWNGYIYKVSNEYVNAINKEIGEVTAYSDMEGTYTGNFSNKYEKGTKYYSIKGISTDTAIAIKEKEGKYRKAVREGKYGKK